MRFPRVLAAALVHGWLTAASAGAQAPPGTITGRAVDSTSQLPVANVRVAVEGTSRVAITRSDGAFTITGIPAGTYRLRATRLGNVAQTADVVVTPGATATVQFRLAVAATTLTELVVTGYGNQRREAVTGSVSTVNADDANVGQVTTPTQLMQGRVPGVNIVQNNGGPGAGVQVRIRSGTSISASNDPLYVIDGVPINNAPVSRRARAPASGKSASSVFRRTRTRIPTSSGSRRRSGTWGSISGLGAGGSPARWSTT